ncbi:DoxX family protein [Mycolicibacterium arseniciresistens]|uniref:DoxX family protein n=1 Tax=Mycolicibacterium arseniciresistens TaxID=3062257 RepID=A0ABT8UCE4_9MYCO|nr:DoxX family protein [Mycolicibacterium arseniciresistens]MDO3635446.1 DoxX family protein [Mycolicibacterium arseniciresistens]
MALIIVSAILAAILAASAGMKLTHRPAVVESYRRAGVPERWLNGLAVLLLIAACALIAGLWWQPASLAAGGFLTAYFVVATAFHLRARDTGRIGVPLVLAALSLAVVSEHL